MLNKRHKIDYRKSPVNDGYVILVGVLIMGAVAVSVATSVILLGIGSSRSSLIQQQGRQAQSVADACAEIAIIELEADSSYAGETIDPFGSGSCIISINQPCTDCTIQATGEIGRVTRKTKLTVTVGSGGSGTIGSGTFPISPDTLTHTVSDAAGDYNITVRDDATTPNQPANETFQIAAGTKPIIHTNDNRVNVGDTVSLDGSAFNSPGVLNTCDCGLLVGYCANLRWDGSEDDADNQTCSLSNGSFSNCSFIIPGTTAGRHDLSGQDPGTGELSCSGVRTSLDQVFLVEPKISATCSGGNTAVISGNGFAGSSTVTILWKNADTASTGSTSSAGSFSNLNFTVPATGTQNIGARDVDYNYATNIENPC